MIDFDGRQEKSKKQLNLKVKERQLILIELELQMGKDFSNFGLSWNFQRKD